MCYVQNSKSAASVCTRPAVGEAAQRISQWTGSCHFYGPS